MRNLRNIGTNVSVMINPDTDGYLGRECPKCEGYFKTMSGTGYTIPQAAKSLGVDPNCVRYWVAELSAEPGLSPTGGGAQAAVIRALRRRNFLRVPMLTRNTCVRVGSGS